MCDQCMLQLEALWLAAETLAAAAAKDSVTFNSWPR